MKVAILGAGAWGTALGVLLASKGIPTALLARRKEQAEALRAHRENKDYLPGVALPAYLFPTSDPEEALSGSEFAVVALPSKALEEALEGLPPAPWYLSATKGLFFREGGLRTASQVIGALTGRPVAALSGPNHAEEVARFLPTASVAAGPEALAQRVQELFSGPTFRVYTSRDLRGVELGGALKNVLALAAGMVDGLRLGDNAKAALLTRGLREMVRFGTALGGEEATFYGLSGLGDLLATAYSLHSRNRGAGERLVRGEARERLEDRGVVEGLYAVKALRAWQEETGTELPIAKAVYQVVYEGLDPLRALSALMAREPKAE
ncbi:NAD(P)H-dependent glycerol-3-phosphate dehydrogenase [Thermus sp.]|uniref:NAD(P)H-dependent glycerol-3-phosphate dehydrogenase n=1 Tax=Thermus sp. TaxID=275 RepID=UPI0025DE4B27|nr:NAD(P)H-dependent glycerol-3-phosphate dehydrogenase [Thermus sp.]MCS6869552.1 NAD(P)H-dependent glycerol-3-phosphate dehydrogenase [Thermus sp.]MDW8356589.1 NAD(P)H-dependent glycerol-3-phosphate dehydrogenase [Thermus sp.]